jgi:hypothetical protein
MPISDNRTLLDAADATTNFVDDAGGTMSLTTNTARIQGTNSIAQQVSAARAGTFYDAGSNQDWSNNVFYIWWNVTTSNLLDSLANLGVTIRFAAGATPNTNYFEVAVAGNNTYSGGWVMSVVDIEQARALALSSPTNNNAAVGGTAPATTAIQYVGVMFDITGMIPGTDPNTFVDAMWRLPAGEPGIIVSGRNDTVSPEVPWTWQDVVDAGDVADTAKAWGSITKKDGVIKLNTPVQFGAQASPDPGIQDFEDFNQVIAWETQNETIPDGFYGFTIIGDGVNTQRFVAGSLSGTVGSQGWVVLADPAGPRWFIEATDPKIERCDFLGCSLLHTGVIDIRSGYVDLRNTLLIDGQRLWHSR